MQRDTISRQAEGGREEALRLVRDRAEGETAKVVRKQGLLGRRGDQDGPGNTASPDEARQGYGFETSIHGHKAFALNVYAMGNAGVPMEIRKNYPITIVYIHDGSVFTVSLYSEGVDVSEIAKVEGGGGHKEAAGFVCHNLPFKPE